MKNTDRYHVLKVREFMKQKVIAVTPDMNLSEVLRIFNKHHISSAPVISSENTKKIIGFISEDDLMREMAGSSFFYGPSEPLQVEEAMTQYSHKLYLDMDVFEVVKLFHEKGLRHVPVVDEQDHLIGIVSRRDILVALEKMIGEQEGYSKELKAPRDLSITNEAKWLLSAR